MFPVLIYLYYNAYRLYRTRLDIPPQTRNRATSPKSAIPQVPNLRFHKSQICDATSPKSAMPQAPNLWCQKVPNLWCHMSQICDAKKSQIFDATSPKSVMPQVPNLWCQKVPKSVISTRIQELKTMPLCVCRNGKFNSSFYRGVRVDPIWLTQISHLLPLTDVSRCWRSENTPWVTFEWPYVMNI